MKSILALLVAILIGGASAWADAPKVEVAIAKDQDSKPTDSFPADVPKLFAFFKSTGTKKGDALRGAWIADDVGDAAPKGTKIDEASVTADQDNFFGAFSLSKPTAGWPVGQYHVDVYAGDQLVTSAKFTITAAEKAEAAEDAEEDKADDEKTDE